MVSGRAMRREVDLGCSVFGTRGGDLDLLVFGTVGWTASGGVKNKQVIGLIEGEDSAFTYDLLIELLCLRHSDGHWQSSARF